MKQSPLQLERYFFSKIQLEANAGAQPQADDLLECQVEIGSAVDNPQRFQVTLKLKLLPPVKHIARYSGEFHIVGFFCVSKEWPDEKRTQLVETNGPAVLYSALREMIYTLTSRGPWPPVKLNSVTFLQSNEVKTKLQRAISPSISRKVTRKSS